MKVAGVIALMFVAAVTGAWAWFHVAPPAPEERLRFELSASISGWEYRAEPLGGKVEAILATTNLVNGMFATPEGKRVTVFAAAWSGADQQSLSVIQHTPDVCWVGGGWVPVSMGQPERVTVDLRGRPLDFECRVFGVPGSGQREMVLWCTLLGGQVLSETDRWVVETDATAERNERFVMAGRRMAAGHFLDNLRARRRATGDKQFVRLSVPVHGDWEDTLDQAKRFAPHWLRLPRPPESLSP